MCWTKEIAAKITIQACSYIFAQKIFLLPKRLAEDAPRLNDWHAQFGQCIVGYQAETFSEGEGGKGVTTDRRRSIAWDPRFLGHYKRQDKTLDRPADMERQQQCERDSKNPRGNLHPNTNDRHLFFLSIWIKFFSTTVFFFSVHHHEEFHCVCI